MASRTITIASSKGGQMKSLLASALAVRASRDGRVAMIDWEPQGSLSGWWRFRGRPDNPSLHEAHGNLAGTVAQLKASHSTIIIDTPPAPQIAIEPAIAAADVVLIPTRVGLFDLGGVLPTIAMCKEERKPFLFVLTGTNPDEPGWPKLIREATRALKRHGPLHTKTIRERAAYISATYQGKTAPEVDKAAAVEIDALWAALKRVRRK